MAEIEIGVSQARLWTHLETLCQDIGPRLSGTPADARAVEYIAGHFRRCGAQVAVQDFPCPAWDHDSTDLTVLDSTGNGGARSLPAVAQTFSLPCDVEAPLVPVGTVQALDLAPDLEGKVLLLYGDAAKGLAPDRNHTLLLLEERRAAGVVVVSPAETVATKLIRDPFLAVPAVAVPQSVGAELARSTDRHVRLRISARRYASTGHNVVGHVPGREPGRIAVAAHYDTAAGVPGATDNASGTAAVLELCHLFATRGTPAFGIDFVAFGADEYGRGQGANLGAAEYVRRHPVEVGMTRAVVEADGIGTAPRRPRVRLIGWPAPRREGLLGVLGRFPDYQVNDESDLATARPTAFNLPAVPAVAFVDDYRFLPIHTAHDTIDLMSAEGLAFAARVMAAVVDHLSSVHPASGGA